MQESCISWWFIPYRNLGKREHLHMRIDRWTMITRLEISGSANAAWRYYKKNQRKNRIKQKIKWKNNKIDYLEKVTNSNLKSYYIAYKQVSIIEGWYRFNTTLYNHIKYSDESKFLITKKKNYVQFLFRCKS